MQAVHFVYYMLPVNETGNLRFHYCLIVLFRMNARTKEALFHANSI